MGFLKRKKRPELYRPHGAQIGADGNKQSGAPGMLGVSANSRLRDVAEDHGSVFVNGAKVSKPKRKAPRQNVRNSSRRKSHVAR